MKPEPASTTTAETWMDEARGLAAQCWCGKETKDIVMDVRIAEAFARQLAEWIEMAAHADRCRVYYRGLLLEKEAACASTQPTPGALSAAQETIATIRHDYADRLCPDAVIAKIIDQKAVKPATAELLAALHAAESKFDLLSEYGLEDESPFICWQAMKSIAKEAKENSRAVIAKHEGRT